jgi:hypothetical protein
MAELEEQESDPYEDFSQALEAARDAAAKAFGKDKPDEKTSTFKADNLKAANKMTRLIFAERRKALAAKTK